MSGISKLIPSHARLATKFVVNALIGMHSTGTWFRSVVIIEANNTFVLHKIRLILHKHSMHCGATPTQDFHNVCTSTCVRDNNRLHLDFSGDDIKTT